MLRRPRVALLGAAGGFGLLILTWFAAFHVGFMQRADERILRGFADLGHPRVEPIANFIAHLCNPQPYVYFAAVPVIVALARRRPRVAVAIVAILFGANETTQLLKPLLAQARPSSLFADHQVNAASWPSGHATAAMSLALCAVLAAPTRIRPWVVALGAAFSIAVSYSFLTLTWHYPSDVFGGFLVAVTWTLLGAAAIIASEGRRARRAEDAPRALSVREALAPTAAVLAGGLALAALVALARPHAVLAYARVHTTFIVGAAAIGTLALAMAAGVMLLYEPASGDAPVPTAVPRHGWHRG